VLHGEDRQEAGIDGQRRRQRHGGFAIELRRDAEAAHERDGVEERAEKDQVRGAAVQEEQHPGH
jgi:hypothetical protein